MSERKRGRPKREFAFLRVRAAVAHIAVNGSPDPVAFILWGGNARSKKRFIDLSRHFLVESAHPSPLSCYNGFFGSKPFSKTNDFLKSIGKTPIDWSL